MSMLKTITTDVTTVNSGSAIDCRKTPFCQRKVICQPRALPLTSTVKIQTAPRDPGTKVAPAAGSSEWRDLATYTSASALAPSEIGPLDDYVRYSTTVLDADGPAVIFDLKGVQ